MSALAVAIACLAFWFVWLDVRPLCDRLVRLRERRLDAEMAREARELALREAAEAAMRPVELPHDLELMAAGWADDDAAESQRKAMREQYAECRAKGASEEEAWRQVRETAFTTDGGYGLPFSLDGMLS